MTRFVIPGQKHTADHITGKFNIAWSRFSRVISTGKCWLHPVWTRDNGCYIKLNQAALTSLGMPIRVVLRRDGNLWSWSYWFNDYRNIQNSINKEYHMLRQIPKCSNSKRPDILTNGSHYLSEQFKQSFFSLDTVTNHVFN